MYGVPYNASLSITRVMQVQSASRKLYKTRDMLEGCTLDLNCKHTKHRKKQVFYHLEIGSERHERGLNDINSNCYIWFR